ncbi:MAG: hypothetical protein AAGF83_14360 [Cyanobacteria bacterium P01_G01_bin.67]
MSKHHGMKSLPAPCIVDEGIVVNQDDIRRLLADLCHVRYVHTIDGAAISEGEGFIQEIFNDYHQSTLIANQKIYINLQSFDYLSLSKSTEDLACYDLIQDNRQLRFIPISRAIQPQVIAKNLDAETIEAMVAEVLSARLDVQLDDEDF